MAISAVLGERPSFEAAPNAPTVRVVPPAEPEAAFAQAMRGLAREIDVGERQMSYACQPHAYDTASLIALQAGIYRYTEAVDLASKIVDRAGNALRTVLQGGGH
jgi:hypothetical protein